MTTHVLMITDKSGSMATVQEDVRAGFNQYLDQLQGSGNDIDVDQFTVSSVLFDTHVHTMCKAVAPADVPRLDWENYQPGGFTALLDAVFNGVKRLELNPAVRPEDRVMVVIQTDGHENHSREATYSQVRELIQRLEATGRWSFLYIGQGPDSWGQGERIGTQSVLNTVNSPESTRTTYGSLGAATRRYASGQSMGAVVDFMEEEHRKAGTLAPEDQG